jgi:hypothetical protein
LKTISALALILLLSTLINAQSKTSKEIDGLIGPVHTVTSVMVDMAIVEGVWVESKRYPGTTIIYDEKGNDGRFGPGDILSESGGSGTPIYNDKGQVSERRVTGHDGIVISKLLFAYDDAGNLTDLSDYDHGKLRRRVVSTFDEQHNRTSLGEYDTENKLYRKLTWTFDEKGNRTEWTESHRQGEEMVIFEKLVDTFDDKNNLLTEIQYGNPEGTVTRSTYVYEFDAQGNWISCERSVLVGDSNEVASRSMTLRAITYYQK